MIMNKIQAKQWPPLNLNLFLNLNHFWFWPVARVKQKTHDCCQPWVLVKVWLCSTSANGVANYDDQTDNLWNVFQHYVFSLQELSGGSSPVFGQFQPLFWLGDGNPAGSGGWNGNWANEKAAESFRAWLK